MQVKFSRTINGVCCQCSHQERSDIEEYPDDITDKELKEIAEEYFPNDMVYQWWFEKITENNKKEKEMKHFDSTGKSIKIGDKVKFRGTIYTIEEFLNTKGASDSPQIRFKETQHTDEIADEFSIDLVV